MFWGPLDNPANAAVPDVNRRELVLMLSLVGLMVWIGVYPKPLFDMMEKPVDYIVQKVDPGYFYKEKLTYPEAPAAHEPEHSEVAAK